MSDIVIGSTLRKNINVIKRTTEQFETISARLATGKIVNSAIDNPQNFFAAKSLNNRSDDFFRRLDNIRQSLQTVVEANTGVESIIKLLDQSEAVVGESLAAVQAGETDPNLVEREVFYSAPTLDQQILADGADIYYRLDNAGVAPVDIGNAGDNNGGNYIGGTTPQSDPIFTNNSDASIDLDGVNGRVRIATDLLINDGDRSEKTSELVFNADTVAGRQVLLEEGGSGVSVNVYIDNGNLYALVRSNTPALFGDTAPRFFSTPVEAGVANHVAITYSATDNNFEGFLNGESFGSFEVNSQDLPGHSGGIGVGYSNGGAWYHTGFQNGAAPNFFDGRVSDVAFYNTALSQEQIQSHSDSLFATVTENTEYNMLRDQINAIVEDANYRGVNLLDSDDLKTSFNEDNSHSLTIEGQDFTSQGLGLEGLTFNDEESIQGVLKQIRDARNVVRSFGTSLSNNLAILQTREDFTQKLINTHNAGADDLTVADQNEVGANLLALQTRLSLSTTALSIGAQNNRAIGNLISSGITA